MKILLKPFQEDAVEQLFAQVADARRRATAGKLEVVTLAAPTGSGKTVMLTRLIELVLDGDENHSPDPHAVFLWLTDQPELNTQTRDKMRATSEFLVWGRAVEIGADFDFEVFPPGAVYFLNTQKLASTSTWVRKSDSRSFTLWDTIRNTVDRDPGRFIVIIDEAHRGTRVDATRADANSIMQKFVLGSDEIPAIPLVVGISATLDRFTDLLTAAARAKKPRTHQRVDVAASDVIESGLLKKKVVLEHAESALGSDFPMLRSAVKVWLEMTQRWLAYCQGQQESQTVTPILVIQVQDGSSGKISKTDLAAVVNAVREEAGELPPYAFAHAFQEGAPLVLEDGLTLRYLAPSAIDADPDVRVVLFKTSLNTGWDCPRAEVMVSFRTAKDSTFIAQLVGRMVRTPLAREVVEDDVLNSVMLVLPGFDDKAVKEVVARLTDADDVPPTTLEDARERTVLTVAAGLTDCVLLSDSLPSYIIPRKKNIREVQRLGALADALSHSGLHVAAGSEARERLTDVLVAEYERLKTSERFKSVVKVEGTITIHLLQIEYATGQADAAGTRQVPISSEMVTELYEWARKRLGLDLGLRYWKRRSKDDESENHLLTKLELYALASESGILDQLSHEAQTVVSHWLEQFKPRIAKLPEAEKQAFDAIRIQVATPTPDVMGLSGRRTLDWSAQADAFRWPGHLYQAADGLLPEKLNTWEIAVLKEEMSRPDFVGWLRNRDRQPWSLCVPYQMGAGWSACYPDFLIFRRQSDDLVVDIVDPHLISLEDAPAKAAGLARYADTNQDSFGRIDLVVVENSEGSTKVKRLRLLDEKTRMKVMGVTTNQHLRDLFAYEG